MPKAFCSVRTTSTAKVAASRGARGLDDHPGPGCGFPGGRVRRAAAPPAAGVAPSAVAESTGVVDLFYVAPNGTVWTGPVHGMTGALQQVSNGKVISAVSGFFGAGVVAIFGEGTDHQLWWTTRVNGTWAPWSSLGGNLTSQPAAVFRGPFNYSVYIRGSNGAVWARDHSTAGWSAWHSIGGQLYGGTGPTAAFLGGTWVMVVGANRQLYIAQLGLTGFTPAGWSTTTSPALIAIPGALVGFARGTEQRRLLPPVPVHLTGLALDGRWSVHGPGGGGR